MRYVDYLLIGGGVASVSCATALRRAGADGTILLVGREPELPYERPPLSKDYLRGGTSREDALLHPETFYAEREIELLTRVSVMRLDTGQKVAKLSNREEVTYGAALLATGANVRRLSAEGAQLQGIHYLRAFGNSDAIRADALADGGPSGRRVVVIGGSYIGCEVAASLTMMGAQCTILMQESTTLERGFGAAVGRWVEGMLRGHGVTVHGGETVARFEGADDRLQRVVTEAGLTLDCDLVVIGAGVGADVMLARSAGLELGESGGIRCDAQLRTSAPDVFAAGDVAEWPSPFHDGRQVRIEHLDGAMAGGRTAALNMLGQNRAYAEVPYLWSDLADWLKLEMVGVPRSWDREIVRGSLDDGIWTVFYVNGERVDGAATVGRGEDLAAARRIIAAGGRLSVPVERLADAEVDLGSLG